MLSRSGRWCSGVVLALLTASVEALVPNAVCSRWRCTAAAPRLARTTLQIDLDTPKPAELLWSVPKWDDGEYVGAGRVRLRRRRRIWNDGDEDVDFHELDKQISRIVRTVSADGLAVKQFSPGTIWLWRQWRDTVLERCWHKVRYVCGWGRETVNFEV